MKQSKKLSKINSTTTPSSQIGSDNNMNDHNKDLDLEPENAINKNDSQSQTQQIQQNGRKLTGIVVNTILTVISLLYLVFGVGFVASVFTHFENWQEKCSNPKCESLLMQHSELYLWDECDYKTLPFQKLDFGLHMT